MEYLIDVAKDEPLWLEFVLDSVVKSSDDLQEKIVALELMGSVFIYKKKHYPIADVMSTRMKVCWD